MAVAALVEGKRERWRCDLRVSARRIVSVSRCVRSTIYVGDVTRLLRVDRCDHLSIYAATRALRVR